MSERPTVNNEPLEIMPMGRTVEQQEAYLRKKADGRGGAHGCLFLAILFSLICSFCAGYFYR